MLFNSFVFWAFFAVVIALYRVLPHRWQNRMLLVASYVFYGTWDWRFLSLILFSTFVDFFVSLRIERADRAGVRKALCLLSICVNLGLLGFFKYYGFFTEELAALLGRLGLPVSVFSLKVILPVGISFYTFQTMGYTIDVYRRVTKPIANFLDFALYVAFFPQLVAGPIERSGNLIPQIVKPRQRRPNDFREGLYLVLLGLFKKIVIAENMATIANAIFRMDPSELSGAEVLVGVYAFALQIYGDFSGYSAIARGISKWMGIDLMVNFRMPYLAVSPSDFWQRWHISLSTWLRDYLYIPLGGNRFGKWKTYRNLMLTMLLGGLWHGAGWTFLAWGLFHGMILCLYRPFEARRATSGPWPWWRTVLATAWMFHLVCFGWLLFRVESIHQAYGMFVKVFGDFRITNLTLYGLALILFYAGPLLVGEYFIDRCGDLMILLRTNWRRRALAYGYLVLMLLYFQSTVQHEFIYFQF